MKELTHRVWTSSIAICLLIVGLILLEESWFPPIVAVALAIIATIGYWEYCHMAILKQLQPAMVIGMVGTWIYMGARLAGLYFPVREGMPPAIGAGAVLFLLALAISIESMIRRKNAISNLAVSAFGFIYVTIPFGLALDILYYLPRLPTEIPISGRFWIIFVLGVTVFTDMGAYFIGKAVGRRKLAPTISPGKTVEGTVGGIAVGIISGMIIYLFNMKQFPWWGAFLLAIALGIVGQFGDLVESLLKRDAGIKDSNRLPGLGGVLDIVDALLFNIPLTYIVVRWVAGVSL
jgi:phosphatidate cytidylyltransferase